MLHDSLSSSRCYTSLGYPSMSLREYCCSNWSLAWWQLNKFGLDINGRLSSLYACIWLVLWDINLLNCLHLLMMRNVWIPTQLLREAFSLAAITARRLVARIHIVILVDVLCLNTMSKALALLQRAYNVTMLTGAGGRLLCSHNDSVLIRCDVPTAITAPQMPQTLLRLS